MRIKHNKIKNTGILFELLVRQVTTDVMSEGDSPAVKILKKYFSNTELAKEQRLYNLVLNNTNFSEQKANFTISTILENAKKLDSEKLNKEKYNLVKEIKKHYDLDSFFKNKLRHYKESAAVYTLLESSKDDVYADAKQIVENKITLVEHLTAAPLVESTDSDIKAYLKESKDIRILTYKILVEKFNEKYSELNEEQKTVLRTYINNINNQHLLKEFVNKQIKELKLLMAIYNKKIADPATQIKISEILNLMQPIKINESVKDDHLVNLLQYHELVGELKKIA